MVFVEPDTSVVKLVPPLPYCDVMRKGEMPTHLSLPCHHYSGELALRSSKWESCHWSLPTTTLWKVCPEPHVGHREELPLNVKVMDEQDARI